MSYSKYKVAAVSILVMLVTACGGGGNSAPSSTEPGPSLPTLPNPPVVTFEINEKSVLSGATYKAYVRATYPSTKVSDWAKDISCTNGVEMFDDGTRSISEIDVRVSDVQVLTESTCIASVTDEHGQTGSDTQVITIFPKTEIGQVVAVFDPPLKLVLPDFSIAGELDSFSRGQVIASVELPDGQIELKALDGTSTIPKSYHVVNETVIPDKFSDVNFVQSPSLFAHGLPDESMSVANVNENIIYWLASGERQSLEPFSYVLSVHEEIEVESPCYVEQTNTYFNNDLLVGQINRGVSVFNLDTGSDVTTLDSFDATLVRNVGEGRSLCALFRYVPEQFIERNPEILAQNSFSSPFSAIDFDSLEFVSYGAINGSEELSELGVIPIETNATNTLNVVQVLSRGSSTQVPQYVLLLLSDGNHFGEHRLVQIILNDVNQSFEQKLLHEWSEGVPISMMQGQFGGSEEGGNFRADLVVVLENTEQSFFFDNLLSLDEGFGTTPIYTSPKLFNVGIGAGSAVAASNPRGDISTEPSYGVLVSYPDTGEIIYINPDND